MIKFVLYLTLKLKSAAKSNGSEINEFERLIGKKMIQIFENESFNEDYIKRLNAKELAYVTSESRLIMISMNICKRSAETELYMANEKIHLMPPCQPQTSGR